MSANSARRTSPSTVNVDAAEDAAVAAVTTTRTNATAEAPARAAKKARLTTASESSRSRSPQRSAMPSHRSRSPSRGEDQRAGRETPSGVGDNVGAVAASADVSADASAASADASAASAAPVDHTRSRSPERFRGENGKVQQLTADASVVPLSTSTSLESVDLVPRHTTLTEAAVAAATPPANERASFVSSDMYVRHHLDLYFEGSASTSSRRGSSNMEQSVSGGGMPTAYNASDDPELIALFEALDRVDLHYPGDGNYVETFPLISPLRSGYNPIADLVHTVYLVAVDSPAAFGDPDKPIDGGIYHDIARSAKKRDHVRLKEHVRSFNDKVLRLRSKNAFRHLVDKPCTYEQTVIILDQVYARAVTDPDALRQYRGFSKEVYGETLHPTINDIIRRIPIRRHDTFLDLGSGIGNVVLQVAAETQCKAYGVELLETPALFARHQLSEFRTRMNMLGRSTGTVKLRKGDFLEDHNVHKILEKATVLFVNNYAFESSVNWRLMQSFLSMKEGATIISFAAFRSPDYVITAHNMNDIASILTVERVSYGPGGVSWTAAPGEYFIHRIDRRPLQKFLDRQQRGVENKARRSKG